VFRNHPSASRITRLANRQRHIEPKRLDRRSFIARQLNPRLPHPPRQTRCVDISHRPVQFQPTFREIAECRENSVIDRLIRLVVSQHQPQRIAR